MAFSVELCAQTSHRDRPNENTTMKGREEKTERKKKSLLPQELANGKYRTAETAHSDFTEKRKNVSGAVSFGRCFFHRRQWRLVTSTPSTSLPFYSFIFVVSLSLLKLIRRATHKNERKNRRRIKSKRNSNKWMNISSNISSSSNNFASHSAAHRTQLKKMPKNRKKIFSIGCPEYV